MTTPAYIVTGGAGFIGAQLAAELLRRDPDATVLCVDDLRSGSFLNLVEACARAGGQPYTGDFLAASTGDVDWPSLLESYQPDAVFHLAAITDTTVDDERTMIEANVEGFRPVLIACVESETPLVYASSAATYGSPPQGRDRIPFPESTAGAPNNVYGFSKWIMEMEHRMIAADCAKAGAGEPHIVGLRFFNVFGPGESRKGKMASMAYQLSQQILQGFRPRLFTDGEQARDQVYVADVVECALAAAEPDATPGVYNLGSGTATSFNELVAAVRRGLGVTEKEFPTEFFEMSDAVRAFYQDYTCADMRQTESALGWRPRFDPITAIEEYAAFLAADKSR